MITKNKTNNNSLRPYKKHKSTYSLDFDYNNTSSNTPSLVFTSNKDDKKVEDAFWKFLDF
ncbi:hypothetical protein DICPUDRAFT_154943 [Dictyostelium purpureum]|uniref:Uncharacterized protein n=1 Tax=Dictyostelium purpureum TaxID=5786 RepID=F0ZSN5_DICPU|nr:uncharacterized protein DICPUDRAFT_154943 [Dictyostelium purpureum]EGC33037.1 hypothetical protein DICPUDRAFT_154943 [Dictyostelium purpureum]|eukprot:XP_003290426.1 hypothetical protein DICPUDRAFT_154943 [Dictyostelium purpureum]